MDSILKAINDKTIKIIAFPENSENLSFIVQGSSVGREVALVNSYIIKFDKNIICTCKDHTMRELMCKHIYFVLLKVFRIPTGAVTCLINDSQLKVLKNIYTNFQRKNVNYTRSPENCRSSEDSDCVICIDKLGTTNIYVCKECKNGFHNECVVDVIKCPLCRKEFLEKEENIVTVTTIFD